MFTNQQHSQTLSFSEESKLFPKFILETSLSGSPENFRITLPAKPGLNDNINLNLSKSCPVELDHLSPDCRGVWLDRGELDKIIERSSQNIKNVQNDNYSDKQRYPTEGNFQYRKKKGLLGELFDF